MQISPKIKVEYVLLALGVVGAAGLAYYFFVRKPPELPYECPYCPARFATFEELAAHIAAEHPGEPVPYALEVKVVEA